MAIRQVGIVFRSLILIIGLLCSGLVFAYGGGGHGGGGHGGGGHGGGGNWHGSGGNWHGGGGNWHRGGWRGGGGGFYVGGPWVDSYEDCYPVRVCSNRGCWIQQRCY